LSNFDERLDWTGLPSTTYRFAMKHCDHLKLSDSHPLEDKCGHAMNPHTNKAWFDLLEETICKYDIQPEDTYGTDEVGIQSHGTECEHVFGARHEGAQYQQCGGTCENTTVLVTICADGTLLPPLMIYKGSAFQVKWAQNNPLNAS